uniref:GYF domain-containing protein n=1 Tax=uncultured myxobacterium HF0070_11L13 TaxID=723554 RepID=E7C206_9BACT|nr:hypothetical protein [uncultured myxobacterium HF0070_11L13]
MSSGDGWMYKIDGNVYGPITAQELLEELYRGEITDDTFVCPEGGKFRPIHEFEVLAEHIEQAKAHQAQTKAIKEKARADKAARNSRRILLLAVTLVLAGGAFAFTIGMIRDYRSEKIADAQEAELKGELAQLLKTVSIEPPLVLETPKSKNVKRGNKTKRKSKRSKKESRASNGSVSTGKLSQGEVMAGVGAVFGQFKNCIVRQIQRDPDSVPARVTLSFMIKNNGSVASPNLDDRILRKSPMMGCMDKAITRVQFRPFKGEVRNVEYPITIGGR